jgi:glycopeptide antibiotics resistance protein
MQRRTNIQDSSLIIILSIITILVQFITYYFFAAFYVIWGIAILAALISCHILLEHTMSYPVCFNYSSLILFISGIILFLSFKGNPSFLPYSNTMLGIAIINWLIPCLYCYLRNMLDNGTRFTDYRLFYRNDALLFSLLYLGVLFYGCFFKGAFPLVYRGSLDTANFIPFEAITVLIEDYLYDIVPLSDVLFYISIRILVFLPYGFQTTLLLRRQSRLPRLLSLLALPCVIEAAQYFAFPERFDIDDIIYAFLGGILGSILYHLCNLIFRAITGKDFLSRESDYPYSRSGLHF